MSKELVIIYWKATVGCTNGSTCPDVDAWEWVYNGYPVYILIIIVLGITFNVFVLMVFCLHKKACTVAEIYLSNLAAADLLLVSCLPFWAVNIFNGFNWPFGLFLCKVVNLGIKMNASCSVYFLVLVSIDRYVALVHTMSLGRMRGPKYAKLGCLLIIWIAGILLSFPALLFRSVEYFPDLGIYACYVAYPHQGWRLRYNMTVNIVGFLIPVPIVSFCSYHMTKKLRKYSRNSVERKAEYLVLVVLAVFILCWLPYQILIFLDTLYYYNIISGCTWVHVLDISNQLTTYLGYSNSSLNPFLYVIVGKHFKRRAREVCRLVLCRKQQRRKSGQSSANLSSTKQSESTRV
uniref:B2 bradykinin receptor n=1 Tax=Monopterus albus TaxID=43700 RepID=A0A3Q3JW36_MONAL